MTGRIRIDEVLRFLDTETAAWLDELRREGLFLDDELTARDAEELRVAATWVRELGVNPAGVDVALQLRRRLLCLEDRMRRLLRELAQEGSGR